MSLLPKYTLSLEEYKLKGASIHPLHWRNRTALLITSLFHLPSCCTQYLDFDSFTRRGLSSNEATILMTVYGTELFLWKFAWGRRGGRFIHKTLEAKRKMEFIRALFKRHVNRYIFERTSMRVLLLPEVLPNLKWSKIQRKLLRKHQRYNFHYATVINFNLWNNQFKAQLKSKTGDFLSTQRIAFDNCAFKCKVYNDCSEKFCE